MLHNYDTILKGNYQQFRYPVPEGNGGRWTLNHTDHQLWLELFFNLMFKYM